MRIAYIIVPLVLVAAVAGFIVWKIAGLKQRMVDDLQAELHAKANIASINLDLGAGELQAAGITLQNLRSDSPWDTASIDQISVHFKFGDLFSSTLPVQIKITGWRVNLHTTAAQPPADGATPDASVATDIDNGDLNGKRVRVNAITATKGEVTIRLSDTDNVIVRGAGFQAETPGGTDWTTHLQVESITAETLTTGPGSVQMHSDADKVTFSDLAVRCGDGQITGSGDLGLAAPHTIHGSFQAASVPLTMLVATRWQVKVSGLVTGAATYQGDDNSAAANGNVAVAGGKFNLFPWLGKATVLVGLPDIGDTTVDQATADFTWKNHLFALQNINIRKNDIFCIAGQANIAADGTCDGHLKLGLPTSVISKWPKLQTDVFSDAHDDFSWTPVHVTGTPDHLDEDLSPRLLEAGAASGGELLQQGAQKAGDLLNSLLK